MAFHNSFNLVPTAKPYLFLKLLTAIQNSSHYYGLTFPGARYQKQKVVIKATPLLCCELHILKIQALWWLRTATTRYNIS